MIQVSHFWASTNSTPSFIAALVTITYIFNCLTQEINTYPTYQSISQLDQEARNVQLFYSRGLAVLWDQWLKASALKEELPG